MTDLGFDCTDEQFLHLHNLFEDRRVNYRLPLPGGTILAGAGKLHLRRGGAEGRASVQIVDMDPVDLPMGPYYPWITLSRDSLQTLGETGRFVPTAVDVV